MNHPTQVSSDNPPQAKTMDLISKLVSSVNTLQQSISDARDENSKLHNAFTSLTDDNNKLNASVSQLQQDNDMLRQELDVLQRNTGVLFPQFQVRHIPPLFDCLNLTLRCV